MIPEGFKTLAKLAPLWKGDYNEDEVYLLLDIVLYEGSSYIAIKDYPEVPPQHDKENWLLVASKGNSADVSVVGVKGQAEEDYRVGYVEITKENIGLGNVDNLSAEDILDLLTVAKIEQILEIQNIKQTIEGKANSKDVVTGVKGANETEYRKGNVSISKKDIGLGNVENYSLEQILASVKEKIKAGQLNGVELFKDAKTTVYASEKETGNTLHLGLMDDKEEFKDLFEKISEIKNEKQLDNFIKEELQDVVMTSSLIPFLENIYRNWLEIKFLEDFHPLVGIRGEAEEVWQTDRYVVTKKGIGLENVPNQNPDKIGTGYIYNTVSYTKGNEINKIAIVPKTFVLQPDRVVTVEFKEDNEIFPVWLDINKTGRRQVAINNKPVDKYTYKTFKKDGRYTFIYQNGLWNLVHLTTKAINCREVVLEKNKWTGKQSPFFYFIEIENLYGNEDFQITVPELSEYQRQAFLHAGVEGERQSSEGILLRAENKPLTDLPIIINISR